MRKRIAFILPLFLPFFLSILLLFGVKFVEEKREAWKTQKRENLCRQLAEDRVEHIRGNCSYESQVNTINSAFNRKIALSCIASDYENPVFSSSIFARDFNDTFPEVFRPRETILYGITFPKSGKPAILTGPRLTVQKGRIIVDLIERFTQAKEKSDNINVALDKRTSGVFGTSTSFRFMAVDRRGKLTPGHFDGKKVFILWDYISIKKRIIGAYLIIFPWKTYRSIHPLSRAMNSKIKAKNTYITALVPLEDAASKLKPCFSRGMKVPISLKKLLLMITTKPNRDEIIPHGELTNWPNFRIYRDHLSINLPYEVWIIFPERLFSQNQVDSILFLLSCGLGFFWVSLFSHILITGQSFYLPLKIWFPAFIAIVGAIPLMGFYYAGLMQLEVSAIRQIQANTDTIRTKLDEIDWGNSAMLVKFKEASQDLVSDKKWKSKVTSDNAKTVQNAMDEAFSHFNKIDIPLDCVYCFPINGDAFGFKPGKIINRFDSGLKFFNSMINGCFQVLDSSLGIYKNASSTREVDQMAEWMVLRAFAGNIGESGKDMIFSVNHSTIAFDAGGEKIFYFQDIIYKDAKPVLYVVFTSKATLGYRERLIKVMEKLNFPESFNIRKTSSHKEPARQFVFGRVIPGGFDPEYPRWHEKFWHTGFGKQLRVLMLRVAKNNALQIQEKKSSLFIGQPCRNADGFIIGAHIPFDEIISETDKKRALHQALTILMASFILVLGLSASRRLIVPLRQVEAGLLKVASGYLDVRVGLDREDELGEMTKAFDRMIVGLKKRREIARFVSGTLDKTVKERTDGGIIKPEFRSGAVLVSDLRSFTTLTEINPAQEIVEMLNRHIEAMTECILLKEGLVEQIIGDAIVAVFYDSGEKSGIVQAVEAASNMRLTHTKLQEERTKRKKFSYEMGIGIDHGKVLTGTIVSSARLEQAILGPARKNAERLESASKKGRFTRIILSQEAVMCPNMSGFSDLFAALPSGEGFELKELLSSAFPRNTT